MFFTYAEKDGGTFFSEWQLRILAFDTVRRYLYYSERTRAGAPLPSVVWKKKVKVTGIVPVCTVDRFDFERNPLLNESDLYLLEVTGEFRPLVKGGGPPIGPLLCPSASLLQSDRKLSWGDNASVEDPFFLRELFVSLRDQFDGISHERSKAEREAAAAGRPPTERQGPPSATLESPRGRFVFESAVKERFSVRCRNELEFRRLWYVIQSVLGYDKLAVRPYRGLPPYDPRNGIAFAHIPMVKWHTFASLDKAVFYVFSRGDVMCVDSTGKSTVALAGVYVCITHDMAMFMRDTGNIPLWLRLHDVSAFHYNVTCSAPFVAFLCDQPSSDVLFVPRPPVYGPTAIDQFDPRFDVMRMRRVMHDACFASLEIRRVTDIQECRDASLCEYVSGVPRPLQYCPAQGPGSRLNCPLPKEQLANVWREVQEELRTRGDLTNQTVIPIYATNLMTLQLSRAQLDRLNDALESRRLNRHEIVGMPIERVRQLPADATPTPRLTADMLVNTSDFAGSPDSSPSTASVASSSAASGYVQRGARYLTQEEVDARAQDEAISSPNGLLADEAYECRSQGSPFRMTASGGGFPYRPEHTVNDLVSCSMAAMGNSETHGT